MSQRCASHRRRRCFQQPASLTGSLAFHLSPQMKRVGVSLSRLTTATSRLRTSPHRQRPEALLCLCERAPPHHLLRRQPGRVAQRPQRPSDPRRHRVVRPRRRRPPSRQQRDSHRCLSHKPAAIVQSPTHLLFCCCAVLHLGARYAKIVPTVRVLLLTNDAASRAIAKQDGLQVRAPSCVPPPRAEQKASTLGPHFSGLTLCDMLSTVG